MLRLIGIGLVGLGVVYLFEAVRGEPILPWRRWQWELVQSLGFAPRLWFLARGGLMIIVGVALIAWSR
ncbi:MAG: hypothetical protein N2651_03455 [Fimbriimonadales bacterium]|nr:hypothetical protein [Fimbriimonadales bacterium]